jgi:hypothetical protein
MKRFIAVSLILAALAGAVITGSLVHAGAPTTMRPYHHESSITVVHTAHGYRIVRSTAQSQR